MTDSPDLPPSSSLPTRFGRYVVQRRLATGGMGEVWIAQDEQLQRRVAIKLMHPSEEPSHAGLERFEREARMIARLQHSHVVQVYDFGRSDDGTPYIVMELLDGEDLRRLLERSRPMSLAAVVPLVVQAAKGLHAAHRAGIVHHDLKPANLFLARQGGEQSLKVLDFGIATMLQADAADGRSTWAGSPAYMSPEQLRGDPIDHRTDLWSLAVVAYEALAGVSPFTGAGLTELRARILRERPLPPSHHVEGLGPDVDAFFARALAKDPRARFSSALELAAAFSALEHPESGRDPSVVGLVRGADMMIYDASYTDDEYPRYRGWGHSTWQEGVRIAEEAGVGRLVIFHHDPNHDDDAMDAIAEQADRARRGTIVAREGMTLDL